MIQDGEHLISTTGEHEQVRCALANAAQWFRDYEQQHLAKDTSEGREKALTNAARAILCEEAAVLAGQLADEADRLQSSPKPSLPSREVVSPTEAEMEAVGSAIADELYERGNQHLKDAMGWLSDDDADAIACAAIRACRAFQPPSPLSDRVERLEQALRPFAEIAKYANGKPDAVWVGQTPAVIRYRDLDDARAALGDGERE